ncbi:hypothetical protein N9H15_01430 [bacterium]|nr:hypothetical protein [bacterium]
MIINFKCTFLSEVVLTSQAATEGFHKSLDFIPGGKFLGIMAKGGYQQKDEKATLNLFHNGNVKFGNAYPLLNNQPSFPMPFVWFRDKLKKEDEVYLHHRIDKDYREKLRKESIQIKQERNGFIDVQGSSIIKLDQKFSIKSAYDSDNRKSKDKEMYGYFSISKGSEFLFSVEINENTVDPDKIRNGLSGVQKIGRSKSAEYGLVEIEEFQLAPQVSNPPKNGTLVLYANSDWCFIDELGYCTVDLRPELFGLSSDSAKILWEKCQIKTRVHQSYNGKRNTTNADFEVIQKGSVIVIETEKNEGLLPTVGNFQNEGFGKVIYNPAFLSSSDVTIPIPKKREENSRPQKANIFEVGNKDDLIISMLTRRATLKDADKTIEAAVEEFVSKTHRSEFKNISKSQWGAIRAIAKSTPDEEELMDLLFHKDKEGNSKMDRGFLQRGIAAKNWERKVDVLLGFIKKHENNKREVLIKTASKMQKRLK